MTITDVLGVLNERKVRLSVVGDELVVRGEKRNLDPAVLSLLREHKHQLMDLVRSGDYVNPAADGSLTVPVPPNLIPAQCTAIVPAMLPLVDLTQDQIETIVSLVPGGAANVQDIYPLAPLQEGFLVHHLMDAAGDPYLLTTLTAFKDRAGLDAYVNALQSVIDRHDILRTAIVWEGLPAPLQVVWRRAQLPVEEIVLEEPDGDAAGQLCARFDPSHYRIDVRQAPLLRAAVARDRVHDRWLLLLSMHHLVVDHSTAELIELEVGAHLSGHADALPAPLPFRNFVVQARGGLREEEHEAFFREMLRDVDEPTAPFGLLEVRGRVTGISHGRLALDPFLAVRLRKSARALGVSAASVFHLAWALVLARTSGRDDVVFGTVLFGRMQGGEGADRVMGLFMNTLPVRMVLEGSVETAVRQTQVVLAELLRHEHASLALAQRCSGVPAPAPLFSAMLNYRHSAVQAPPAEVLRAWEGIERLRVVDRSNYPLILAVDDFGDDFELIAQSSDSVDAGRLCRLMETSLEHLVEALEWTPDAPLHDVDVLPDSERRQLLEEWNDTRAPFEADRCIHELFEAQAARTPDAPAISHEDGALSYAELNARANRLAHFLVALGVRPDDRVAICVERGTEMIVAVLAVWKAGGAFVPLDPAYPPQRIAAMLEDCEPVVVLADRHLDASVPVIDFGTPTWSAMSPENLDPRSRGLDPEHLAYVIYTSGSTGRPKGVLVRHRGVCNLAQVQIRELDVTPRSRVLQFASFSFDACVWEITMTLCSGACLVVPERGTVLAGDALVDAVERGRVTHVTLTPAVLAALPSDADLAPVQTLIVAGDALPQALAQRWSTGRRLINAYGPTEGTVCATMKDVAADEVGSPSIGTPISNTRIYVLDGAERPVPISVAGEICIGGVGVARGYWKRPELTAEKFVSDPFSGEPGARMYRTGDLGRWRPDGTIEFLGRKDSQVKVRGVRIEPGEVEARLVEHAGVRDAIVIARESEIGDKRLVAYVVPRGPRLSHDELRMHLQEMLPESMVPSSFVQLDALPLTPNGKVDRKALPAPQDAGGDASAFEAAEGRLEQIVAEVWSRVLEVERLGRRDHFFELGGESLLAVQVIWRLRQALGVEIAMNALFEHPVLADFARELGNITEAKLPPITAAAGDERHALSFAQQRIWFLSQMDDGSAAYHIPFALRLRGPLNRNALRQALDRLVARHEVLRTTFASVDDEPRAFIADAVDRGFFLLEQEISEERELEALAAEEWSAPFDLQHGPLIRGRLIRMGERDHALLITQHHIVSDGWSMSVMLHELSVLYDAFCAGGHDPLPPLAVQYADYAAWQRRTMDGEGLRKQADYWKSALAGAPALLELPTDRPRPAQQDFAGALIECTLDEELTQGLRALSQRHGTTLFMTLLASWAALLARLSGQSEVVIGTPVANRGRAEIEALIGFFVNTLAIRVDVSGSPSVGELLRRVKDQALAAQENQDIPFEQVVELARPVRSLAHSPLFQAAFTWQPAGEGTLELSGLTVEPAPMPARVAAKYDVTLLLRDSGDVITCCAEYATALFERSTIERYLDHWRTLVRAMVADELTIDRLPLLTSTERRRIVEQWNETRADFAATACIHELFESQVSRRPEADAVVADGGALTYAELNGRANQLAHYLRELGVTPDSRVAICAERGTAMVIALLAVLKSGGAYVPLDPSYPADRLRYMLEDSSPVALLTQGHLQEKWRDGGGRVPVVLDLASPAPAWERMPRTNPDRDAAGLEPGHLAYVIYTSGSTGTPKGVMVEHRGLCNLVTAQSHAVGIEPDSRILQFSSFSFDACIFEIVMALCQGASLHLPAPDVVLAGDALLDAVARHSVTHVTLPPSVLAALPERADLGSVRTMVVAGEAVSGVLVARWSRGRRFINAYGPTEATVWASFHVCGDDTWNPPIGRPIANARMYVLDPLGEPVPVGVAGEIHIGGAGVARGYLNRPGLTAEKFVRDPFSEEPGARMYRTGDLGRYLADGSIEFLGRNDFQVKVRGFRIEPGEIESRLAAHPAVRDAVVLTREERLIAYYVAAADAELGAEDLRQLLRAALPEHMIPSAYVRLDAMPLTANGKVDRNAFPSPDADAYGVRVYEEPRGEDEAVVAEIFSTLLGIERVGRHDDFFRMGGHSLLAVTLMERMRRKGLQADVRAVFLSPTVAGLAAAVSRETKSVDVPPNAIAPGCQRITPSMLPLVSLTQPEIDRIVSGVAGGAANVQDIYPLAPLQEGILFHHLMARERDPYLVAKLFRFATQEKLDRYVAALQAVMRRHDILRTAVVWEGLSTPVQVVWRDAPLSVEEVVFDAEAGDVAGQLYERFSPRRYRMDVRRAPLTHVCIAFDAVRGNWLLLLLSHHLINDHSTGEVLQEEIQAHLSGRANALPPALPFRNFVAQARLGVSEEEHEAFFRRLLGDVHEPTAPFGLLEVQGDGSEVEEARLELDEELARRIRERARVLGVSAASLCHLAWAQVLARVCGRDDVVFGTLLFGRMQGGEGADRVLGLFINTLPVRIHVGDEEVELSVRRTHLLLADLLRHEHAPLALAQRCSGVQAPLPLFSSLLNYRHNPGAAAASSNDAWDGIESVRGEERTNYPLVLAIDDVAERFELTVQLQTGFGPMRVCLLMESALRQLVDALTHAPRTPLRALDVMPAEERALILDEWNATESDYPRDRCIHSLFEAQALKAPAAVAIVFEGRTLTYGELNDRANQLSHFLIALGVRPGDRVATFLERSPELVIAEIAILKCGAAYVPLDQNAPSERQAFMIDDCQVTAVITITGLVLPATAAARVNLDEDAWREHGTENPPPSPETTSDAAAYVMYTSGSTGQPKGVVIPHRGIARLVLNNGCTRFDERDRIAFTANPAFDASTFEMWSALLHGARVVLIPQGVLLDAEALARTLREEQVTVLQLVAGLLGAYAEPLGDVFPQLRYLVTGGDVVDPRAIERVLRNPPRHLIQTYGPTETTTFVTAWDVTEVAEGAKSIPIGRALSNTRIYILDETRRPAPLGVTGEIYIGGDGIAHGYWNRPELTAEKFLADPFTNGRMYRTGDLARWLPDGKIDFLGRNDAQVKIRGIRIEPAEIEARLAEHPAVREAVVLGLANGSGDKRLVAYVVWKSAEGMDAEALRAFVKERLPEAMVPAAYVRMDALPLTANGKVDRKALPAPEDDGHAAGAYEAPQSEVESVLAAIWSELFARERISRHDNFFSLGGHSLLAVTLMERMRARRLRTDVQTIFSTGTLADLAAATRSVKEVRL